MKELRRQMSELIFADRGPARTIRSVIVALAIAVSGPAVALTINLTYDPDSTFTTAGLSAADIVNMKAAASMQLRSLPTILLTTSTVNTKEPPFREGLQFAAATPP